MADNLAMPRKRSYNAMHDRADSFLAKSGVTLDEYFLLHITASKGAVTQEALVARATLEPNTVEQLLVLLERRGLVARHWQLTRRGHNVYKRLRQRQQTKRASRQRRNREPAGPVAANV